MGSADSTQSNNNNSRLRFQINIPENLVPAQSGTSHPTSGSAPSVLQITMLSGDSADLLKLSICAHVHEHTGAWRPHSTFQLVQSSRHVRFWEPLTSSTLNEPVNVVITQLAFREPSAIFTAITDVNMGLD